MYFTPNLMLGALILSAFDSVVLSAPINSAPDHSSPTPSKFSGAPTSTNGFSDSVNGKPVGHNNAGPSATLRADSQGAGTSQNQVTKKYVSQESPSFEPTGAPRSASTKPPQYPISTTSRLAARGPPSGLSAVQHLI